jgi:hypothetical protein
MLHGGLSGEQLFVLIVVAMDTLNRQDGQIQ